MRIDDESAVAAERSVSGLDVAVWEAGLEELLVRVDPCFVSEQPRVQARAYVAGLLSRAERKNGWTLAEFTGQAGPQKMQRLLNGYVRNADRVRDVVASYVIENLAGERRLPGTGRARPARTPRQDGPGPSSMTASSTR
ncbi:hypothetical protein FRAHR75_980005 [Frankia sp. Hr75.2]|nr:hypothetical protein FRAHR75_980005 [Frankia sp. Hr75.2]